MAEETPSEANRSNDEGGKDDPDLDAMGHDKRRGVVGEQYGATVRKRLLVYGAVVGVIILVVIASLTLVKGIDQSEIPLKDTAPWTKAKSLEPPRDIDYTANGPANNIPPGQIVNR